MSATETKSNPLHQQYPIVAGSVLGKKQSAHGTGLKMLHNLSELIPRLRLVRDIKATLGFLLTIAFQENYQMELYNAFSFQGCWFYHCPLSRMSNTKEITEEMIKNVSKLMEYWLSNDYEQNVECTSLGRDFLKAQFNDREDKMGLLKIWLADPVPVVRFGNYLDLRYGTIETDKNKLRDNYHLIKYQHGVLLQFKDIETPTMKQFEDLPSFFKSLMNQEEWADNLKVNTIGDLNQHVFHRHIYDLLYVSEALHERMFSNLADSLHESFPKRRIVCIAGPSASGKTTVAWRLKIALRARGYSTILLGMDTYYKNSDEVPLTSEGVTDYDCVESIHIDLLVQRINSLLEGKTIPIRKYHFPTHQGFDTDQQIKLENNSFIIVEGIHGFNTVFTKKLGEDRIYRAFVSAFTPVNIDNNHHFRSSDVRLFRRLLRDHRSRGFPSDDTLSRWAEVRRNEEINIFPFQKFADVYINTTLAYELPVLANYCKPLLAEVKSPSVSQEAERLLRLLSLIYPISDDYVPSHSILCEFLCRTPYPVDMDEAKF